MDAQSMIVFLFLATAVLTLITIISVGVIIWQRKAIFDQIKLKKLIKNGYIICRLKRHDKTEIQSVQIPDKETNSIKFAGVEGIYTLDDASVILKDRKYPVYEWREGETTPINYEKDYIETNIKCPMCEESFNTRVQRIKSINPSVLDNLIMKIKTLSQMVGMNKYLQLMLILLIIVGVGVGINFFWIDDFKN